MKFLVISTLFLSIGLNAAEIGALKSRSDCINLISVFANNPRTRANNIFAKNDGLVVRGNGVNETDPSQIGRDLLLSVARYPEQLPLLRQSVLSDLRKKSQKIAARIEGLNNGSFSSELYFDHLIIGAGPQAGILTNSISNNNPSLKGLVIESSDNIATNFAVDFFRINSTSRPDIAGLPAGPGVGNLNRLLGGPVQVPDISAAKYPSGRAIADATLLNFAAQGNDILFKHKVVRVSRRQLQQGPEALYEVTLLREDGKLVKVFTNHIFNTTGLGEENFDFLSAEAKVLFKESSDSIPAGFLYDNIERDLPSVLSFNQLRQIATSNATPFRPFAGKEVMVIGDGDSGRVAIEWLIREAPEDFYGEDVTQAGIVKKIVWAGVKQENCVDYITQNRVRYSAIAANFKNQTLDPVNGKVNTFRKLPNGRIQVTINLRNGGTVEKEVDRVIFATGYKSNSNNVYADFIEESGTNIGNSPAIEGSDLLKPVSGNIGNEILPIAKQLTLPNKTVPENIWWAGPVVSEIVPSNATAGVPQNKVSIFNNGPRVSELGRQYSATVARNYSPIGIENNDLKLVFTKTVGEGYQLFFEAQPVNLKGVQLLKPHEDLYLLSKFTSIFNKYKLQLNLDSSAIAPAGEIEWIKIYFETLSDGRIIGNLLLKEKNGDVLKMDPSFENSLRELILKDGEAFPLIQKFLNGSSPDSKLKINLKWRTINEINQLDYARSSIELNVDDFN
jgi:hypothetical protein